MVIFVCENNCLPLISELIPSLLTNVLSTASEFVNNSATTYKFGFTFRAASNKYCKKKETK